jgi:hypothetical protein
MGLVPGHRVVGHDHRDFDSTLTAEQLLRLRPQLGADLVIAEEGASEPNDRRILLGYTGQLSTELHDVDHRLVEPGFQSGRLVRRPFVMLVEFARGDERRQLEVLRAGNGLPQDLVQGKDRLGRLRAVHRDGGRSGPRDRFRGAGERIPDPFSLVVEIGALDGWKP